MRNFSTADERSEGEGEAKAAFHLRMRARGIQDRDVLRAFELVARRTFVPSRYQNLASRDVPVPIDCGQTMHEPGLVARMIESLQVRSSHRVLEIGSGTGYATAVLAVLAGRIVGIERFQGLASTAQARLAALAVGNATIAWGDGLAMPRGHGSFDRILVHGLLQAPRDLLVRLVPDGMLVCAIVADGGQQLVCLKAAGGEIRLGSCRLQPLIPGAAAVL